MARPKDDPVFFRLFAPKPRKSDLRRAAIVRAAIDCIATIGIEALSLDTLGKRIGLRRSHIAYYYKEKREIVEAAIRVITSTAQEMTLERVKQATRPKDQLIAVIDGAYDWARAYPNQVSVLQLFYYYCTYHRGYRDLNTQIRKTGQERMLAILEDAVKSSRDRARLPTILREIQVLVLGQITEHFATNSPDSLDEQRDRSVEAVLRLIDPILK